jgi:hypothetical protein
MLAELLSTGHDMLTRTSSAVVTAAVAISAPAPRSGESLVVLIILSLGALAAHPVRFHPPRRRIRPNDRFRDGSHGVMPGENL